MKREAVDVFNAIGARKSGTDRPNEWTWSTSRVIGTGDDRVYLVEGGVPRTLTRGPRKGQKTFDGVKLDEVVVTIADIEAEKRRVEAETGQCYDCDGTRVWCDVACPRCTSHVRVEDGES